LPVMAGVELTVERVDWAVRVEFWWRLAIGFVTIALVLAAVVYGSAPSSGSRPAPAPRTATQAQIAGLTSVLARDWGRARAADHAWFAKCYDSSIGYGCASALHRQVTALQRLQRDISAQRLAGTQLGAIADGHFLHSVAAALAIKETALALLPMGHAFPDGRSTAQTPLVSTVLKPPTLIQINSFLRHNIDPVVCIEPVAAAIQKALGQGASHPLFRSYPLSNGYFPISGRGSCPTAPPVT